MKSGDGTVARRPKPRLIAVLLGMAALVAVVGGGVALGTSMSAQPEPPPAPKTATVPSQLSAHFAALDTSTAGSAGIASASSETQSHLESSAKGLDEQFGLNPSLARRVSYGDAHLWVEPGSAGMCVTDYEGAGGGSCGSIAEALEGSIAVGVGNTGSVVVYGLVPNGNSQIVVHDADGTTEDVPVENNVYIIRHSGAVSAEVIDAGGQHTTVELPR
jgi:hypothetical protein